MARRGAPQTPRLPKDDARPPGPEGAPGWRGFIATHLFWTGVLVLAGFLVAGGVWGSRGIYSLYLLKQEREALSLANSEIRDENARLLKTIDRLHNDREMLEDLIRKELNFVKKNEIIYQLLPERAAAPQPAREPAGGQAHRRR